LILKRIVTANKKEKWVRAIGKGSEMENAKESMAVFRILMKEKKKQR
jgi:hypothetical protein